MLIIGVWIEAGCLRLLLGLSLFLLLVCWVCVLFGSILFVSVGIVVGARCLDCFACGWLFCGGLGGWLRCCVCLLCFGFMVCLYVVV